ncbi:nucleoside hydrolase, partial [Flavobacterium sp. IR1]
MIRKMFLLTLLVFSITFSYGGQETKPVPVIFDSDMGFDYDDVGALAVLHALSDNGEAKILATISSTKYEGVAAVMDVLNTYY